MTAESAEERLKREQTLLAEDHTPDAIRARLEAGPQPSYLRDLVYGATDGAVTTFAVVSGVVGAGLQSEIVLILGAANLAGDGFSMAAGNFLGTRAEVQQRERARRAEERQVDLYPEGEREEVRQILHAEGFDGEDLDRAVDVITADRERWVDRMLTAELGFPAHQPSPMKNALATFIAFIVVGAIPLISFLVEQLAPSLMTAPFVWSTALTGVAFLAVGAYKARFVDQSPIYAAVETLAIGGSAATIAFFVGKFLQWLV